ncbi:SAM-dependent methyltransferase [Pseudomonas nitroreducens]|uniref:methyltransferase n=1 Tax=Pseudomonas TaxID=286 RepID=UPI0007EE4663|nr:MULTISPECIES: methyltransferase [Pseudomonas]MDG9856348.1 SAM-dependent methyltransferase [Pseudomonas nitroreducens]MDH1073716.1 SAM-dependent methyltransferase [Pseudomonas nitroreducens]NMZ71632.1 methyltransferase [Pseudomonas nitroreducens]OBY55822.1 SAM-dependent methyltransferase [Pseudomonas sp. AU12215]UCL86710.1 SAM-dependent methyltransferase [Pseudomonas sp. HS-18]
MLSNDTPLTGPDLLQRFLALDGFLLDHQALWRPKPFTALELAWEREHPELAAWLRSRSLDDAEAVHNAPEQLDAPAPFPALAATAAKLSVVGELPATPLGKLPNQLTVDVPGRKWQQIEAFASRLDFAEAPQQWLDWCAGKGHLGRLLARDGKPLLSLEFNHALVEDGQRLSDRLQLHARHHQQDVLAPDVREHLQTERTAVALHACGNLHVRLLQLASAQGCRQLAVAPCCYNRIDSEYYQPLSHAAQSSTLLLSRDDLRLPLAETVTAGARVRRQRDGSMARRLAFDLLQREVRGSNDYLPTPSVPPTWLDKPFADYCRDLAALRELDLPTGTDWQELEARGWQRLAQVRNLELVRGLFRRPMELWLLLDRALFLEEQGYRATLGAFCATRMTPRNLLLLAERI